MFNLEEVKRIQSETIKRKKDLEDELRNLTDGELYSRSIDGKPYYFKRLRKEGNRKKERRYGISGNQEMIKELVRKRYVEEALVRIDANIKVYEELIDKLRPTDENSVMEDFLKKYPDLADGIYHGIVSDEAWADIRSAESDYHRENLTSTASDGTYRRSKGEILIGAKLVHYGIPYRYEVRVHPDLPYLADFKIRRPRDKKILFWEHLGKVNDRNYMSGNRRKFDDYEEVGIVPWDNLIISYDQADGGISEKLIDSMIHGWLL